MLEDLFGVIKGIAIAGLFVLLMIVSADMVAYHKHRLDQKYY